MVIAATKKGKCLGRCGASNGHTTKLKQSILFRYLWKYFFLIDFFSIFHNNGYFCPSNRSTLRSKSGRFDQPAPHSQGFETDTTLSKLFMANTATPGCSASTHCKHNGTATGVRKIEHKCFFSHQNLMRFSCLQNTKSRHRFAIFIPIKVFYGCKNQYCTHFYRFKAVTAVKVSKSRLSR
jgi:hypothetical protein